MKKFFVYIEPHPIRNSYVEFKTHALFFVINLILSTISDHSVKLFSNAHILTEIEKSYPDIAIDWPISVLPSLSIKDAKAANFKTAEVFA